jgi:hypothetical protein
MVTSAQLMELLDAIDPYLPQRVRLIAVGGTAMTLQGLKDSTIDVDFDIADFGEYESFRATLATLGFQNIKPGATNLKVLSPNGMIIDIFSAHYIFCVQLVDPVDTTQVRTYRRIELSVLNPYDLIITKTARSDTRDYEDILTIARTVPLDYNRLLKRYQETAMRSVVAHAPQFLLDVLTFLKKKGIAIPATTLKHARTWNESKNN